MLPESELHSGGCLAESPVRSHVNTTQRAAVGRIYLGENVGKEGNTERYIAKKKNSVISNI